MKKKIIQTPRGYLSFSQITLWMSNRDRYKKLYFDSDDSARFSNSGMEFGGLVADALENQTETNDLLTDIAIELLPKYDVRDQEIRVSMKTKDGWIDIVGKPDSLDSETKNFYEFKTGKVPWTQAKAEKHLQLKMYALLVYLKYGVRVDHTELIWMETHTDVDGRVQPTGRIERFKVKITLKDILETMSLISKVAKEIEADWVIYEPAPEISF